MRLFVYSSPKGGYMSYTTHRHVCEIGPHTRNRPRIEVGCCSWFNNIVVIIKF